LTSKEKRELKEIKRLNRGPYVPETQKFAYQKQQEVFKQTLCMGKRRSAKGPNPLSCKKKAVEAPIPEKPNTK